MELKQLNEVLLNEDGLNDLTGGHHLKIKSKDDKAKWEFKLQGNTLMVNDQAFTDWVVKHKGYLNEILEILQRVSKQTLQDKSLEGVVEYISSYIGKNSAPVDFIVKSDGKIAFAGHNEIP